MSTPPSRKRKADACFPLATVSKRPRIKAPESWEINDSPAILTITNATTPRSLGEVAIKRLRILVLDGEHSHSSGVLSALEVLRELITRVGYDIGDNNVAPWKLFDLIVGSGDGGWVALMLGRLRMSIAQIIEEYQRIHEQIYHMTSTTSAEERAILFDGLLKDLVARYSTTKNPDEPLLSPLSETECLTVVLAMARENMAFPVLFRTYSARNFSFVRSCSVRSAVRAATSFSPLFPELTLDGQNYVSASRFGHCNPITTALSEAQMMFPGAEISSIVSIGCGHPGPISYSDTFPGAAAFMLANDAERQSSQADKYFQTQRGKVYFRFNVDQGFQAFCLGHGKKYCEALAHTRAYCARTEVSDRLNAAILCLSSSQTSQSEKTIFQSSHCPTSCSSSGVASINSSVLDPRLQLLLTSLRQVDFGDYELTDEVVTRPNYSFHYGRIISTNKRVLVQRFEGRHASERKRRSLQGNLIGKDPRLLSVIYFSNTDCPDPCVFYSNENLVLAQKQLSHALLESNTKSLSRQGISLIGNLASALRFLQNKSESFIPVTLSSRLEDFTVFAKSEVEFVLAFTPPLKGQNFEHPIDAALLQLLCSETLAEASQEAQRDHSLLDKTTLIREQPTVQQSDRSASGGGSSSQSSTPNSNNTLPSQPAGAHTDSELSITLKERSDSRLFTWQNNATTNVTLTSISDDFSKLIQRNLQTLIRLQLLQLTAPRNRRISGCPGYRRDEIRLSLIADSHAIIIHDEPFEGEPCPACEKHHRKMSPSPDPATAQSRTLPPSLEKTPSNTTQVYNSPPPPQTGSMPYTNTSPPLPSPAPTTAQSLPMPPNPVNPSSSPPPRILTPSYAAHSYNIAAAMDNTRPSIAPLLGPPGHPQPGIPVNLSRQPPTHLMRVPQVSNNQQPPQMNPVQQPQAALYGQHIQQMSQTQVPPQLSEAQALQHREQQQQQQQASRSAPQMSQRYQHYPHLGVGPGQGQQPGRQVVGSGHPYYNLMWQQQTQGINPALAQAFWVIQQAQAYGRTPLFNGQPMSPEMQAAVRQEMQLQVQRVQRQAQRQAEPQGQPQQHIPRRE